MIRVRPTSIMHAPGFTMSAVINPGTPAAVTIISANLQNAFSSSGGVNRWQIVTVASMAHVSLRPSACNSIEMGIPTFFERPTTTAFLPNVSTPVRLINSCTPSGVQGISVFMSRHSRPTFFSLNPSTSLKQLTELQMRRSFMWPGTGNCTRIPSTPSSAFSCSMRASSSSSVMVGDKFLVTLLMPTSSAAFVFEQPLYIA